MKPCDCTARDLGQEQRPGVASKLRSVDELNRPAEESLLQVGSKRLLRPRVVELEDRIKVVVAEAADETGDVRRDADGAHLVFAGVVSRGAAGARPAAAPMVARAVAKATWLAGLRESIEYRWQERGAPPVKRCAACGGAPAFLDHSAEATHRDPNELVLSTPRGHFARVRAVLVEAPSNASVLPIHLTIAHAIDESGDVVRGAGGEHRIVDCGVHTINLDCTEHDVITGRPTRSLSATVADLVLTECLTRLEAAIVARAAYERVPFLKQKETP